jgi:hypothetical protein
MNNKLWVVVAATFFLCSVATAQITTFTSFNPGYGYDTTQGFVIDGPTAPISQQRAASQFTSSETGALHSVRFGTWYNAGSTELHVKLYDDNANSIGNGLIEWSYNNTNKVSHIDLLVNPASAPVLQSGQKYWLELFSVLNGEHVWNRASAGHTTRLALSTNDGASYSYFNNVLDTAFEVNVVPEPSAIAAIGLGLIGLASLRVRSRAC